MNVKVNAPAPAAPAADKKTNPFAALESQKEQEAAAEAVESKDEIDLNDDGPQIEERSIPSAVFGAAGSSESSSSSSASTGALARLKAGK